MTSASTQLVVGDWIRLLVVSESLLKDLPAEDRCAIRAAVGGTYRIESFDAQGNAEIEFVAADDVHHTIWIDCVSAEKVIEVG